MGHQGESGRRLLSQRQENDPKSIVRLAAAQVLGDIGPEASEAAPALTELLKDENPSVGVAAGEALKEIREVPDNFSTFSATK